MNRAAANVVVAGDTHDCSCHDGPRHAPSDAALTALGEAHAVLVWTSEDRYSRRVLLSLHTATKALERARARGHEAEIVLVRLVPVGGECPC